MTEIKIEKKKLVWPWIVLVLGLLFVVWFFFVGNDKADPAETEENTVLIDAQETEENTELIDAQENNNIVTAYVKFINSNTATMGIDHVFAHQAFTKLTNAVDAMATEAGYDVKADIAKAKQLADEITNDPMKTAHADKIRSGADLLSTCLQNIQKAKYPSLSAEATDVKNAASSINPEILTLDQRAAVKSFFRKSADLLSKMN